MSRHQTGNSLIRALNVINTALIENAERFPWSQVLDAARNRLSGEKLVIAVDDDRSETDHREKFVVQVRNNRFCLVGDDMAEPDDSSSSDSMRGSAAKVDWAVTTCYLDDLARRARYYVEHPARIGLDWLTERLGLVEPGRQSATQLKGSI